MSNRVSGDATVRPADADFRVCVATVEELLRIQHESERMGWASRWSSSQALLEEVGDKRIYICPLIRVRRDAEGLATKYRCLVLYRRRSAPGGGGVVTFDIGSEALMALPSLALPPDAQLAFADLFSRAMDGIDGVAMKD
jgi:hypothetical protein